MKLICFVINQEEHSLTGMICTNFVIKWHDFDPFYNQSSKTEKICLTL